MTSSHQTVENWRRELKFDPLPPLLSSGKKALEYSARRGLLGEPSGPPRVLWNLPEAKRVLAGQQPDGGWKSRGVEKHPAVNYRLIETWRRFRYPVEQYGFTREKKLWVSLAICRVLTRFLG
ncbi:MAG: hypothetical protein P9M08_02845 [Candidatus Erginobacter occultus]|nr:hypothetical protein [Candidatus Erginobacter occultus]